MNLWLVVGGLCLIFVLGWDLRSGWPFRWDEFSLVRDPVLAFYALFGPYCVYEGLELSRPTTGGKR